jgi:hypothetical protein
METEKEKLINVIKEWMINDKELKQLQLATKERREKKKLLTAVLVNEMNKTNIDEYKTQNGKLIKTSQKNKKPISKSYLTTCIDKIFKSNPEEGKKVLQFIDENREIKVKENIRLK